MSKALQLAGFAVVAAISFASTCLAAWPERQITIMMQTPPGTIMDVVTRPLAQSLSASLGQTVIVESRVGAGGLVLMKALQNARPDGYTLGLTAVGPAVIHPLMNPKVGFDFDKDFTPIVPFGDIPNTLLVSPKLGVNSLAEFVAYAKAHPDTTMAYGGAGTIGQLAAILFAKDSGIKLNFVSYKGSGQMITDLIGGQIAAGFPPYNPAAKNVKILAVATDKRLDFLPGVPTMAESGYPNVLATTWIALVGPAGLPPEIVARLNKLVNAWLDDPQHRQQFGKLGFRLTGGAPDAITRQVTDDRARWSGILRENNITLAPQP